MGGGEATGVEDGVAWLAETPPRPGRIQQTSALPPMLPAGCWVDLSALQEGAPDMPWVGPSMDVDADTVSHAQRAPSPPPRRSKRKHNEANTDDNGDDAIFDEQHLQSSAFNLGSPT